MVTSPTADGQGWRPIETAPTRSYDPERWYAPHSERMLVFVEGFAQIATYHYNQPRGKNGKPKGKWQEGLCGRVLAQPTHWMPLPSPPTSGDGA